jgi:hypothetical protein
VCKKNKERVPSRDLTNVIPWVVTSMRRIKFMILTVYNIRATLFFFRVLCNLLEIYILDDSHFFVQTWRSIYAGVYGSGCVCVIVIIATFVVFCHSLKLDYTLGSNWYYVQITYFFVSCIFSRIAWKCHRNYLKCLTRVVAAHFWLRVYWNWRSKCCERWMCL